VDRPEIILAPGPTPIPPEVLLAQGSPLVYHRGPGFGDLMRDVTGRLRELYRTHAAEIFLLTSSGTGGLESAVQNLLSPGDEVFVPLAGFFSQRWQRLATAYGLTVHASEDPWGTRIDPDAFGERLAVHPNIKAVLLTQSETSTGVMQPVRELAAVAREAGVLVVVDVVSSLGAVPFDFDGWGVDVAGGGSQKALAASPGVAVAAASRRARSSRWARARVRRPRPRPCRSSTSTGTNIGPSRRCRTPRTRGRRRSACCRGSARHSSCTSRTGSTRRCTATRRSAARSRTGSRRSASICSARASRTIGPCPRS